MLGTLDEAQLLSKDNIAFNVDLIFYDITYMCRL